MNPLRMNRSAATTDHQPLATGHGCHSPLVTRHSPLPLRTTDHCRTVADCRRLSSGHRVTVSPCHRVCRSAFTMAEVIFAVIVLGIGLILLAAAFPVGIKQSQKTQDSTNAALIAQHAYDQLTKVPAANSGPNNTWVPTPLAPPVDKYAGKPLTMGLLDGSLPNNAAGADLRVKLVYPELPPLNDPQNLTVNDYYPQDPTSSASIGSAMVMQTASHLSIWGWRLEGAGTWYENVQWVYPADRRYYWYAFYRQMNEDLTGYPNPIKSPDWTTITNGAARLEAVKRDHITRRTYRVNIVICKVSHPLTIPYGAGTLTLDQIQPPMWFAAKFAGDPNATPAAYAAQWNSLQAHLYPTRIPDQDIAPPFPIGIDAAKSANNDVISDNGANTNLQAGITAGQIKRGGIVLDAWGNIFQIVDVGTNWVRLDRSLLSGGTAALDDVLPLWFNPNAIGVFPTVVTKQADLP